MTIDFQNESIILYLTEQVECLNMVFLFRLLVVLDFQRKEHLIRDS